MIYKLGMFISVLALKCTIRAITYSIVNQCANSPNMN